MTISENGISFICSFEGFSATPYPDPASGGKPYTIGYGTTVYPNSTPVSLSDAAVTTDQAKGFLEDHVNKNISGWLSANLPGLSQNRFDALCSFIYNLGLANFEASSLLKAIRAGADNNTITTDFEKWDEAGGKVMTGLEKRRAAEAALYCNGTYIA